MNNTHPTIREAAETLVQANIGSESSIQEILLFPSDKEIRIVELLPDAMISEDEEVSPFYFAPDPDGGIPYPSGIAMIRPEDKQRLNPPAEWGSWDEAKRIWPIEANAL